MVSLVKDWEWFITKIRELEQISDRNRLEIRSVMTRGKEWMHYATCLYIPSRLASAESYQQRCMIYPQVAFLAKDVPLQTITSFESVVNQIKSWEPLGECSFPEIEVPKPGFPVYFLGSHNEFGELPVWRFELGNGTAMGDNYGPLLHPELPLYGDVVEASADWLRDPLILTNHRPTYVCRFFLTTSHAYIKDMNLDDDNKLSIRIEPISNMTGLILKSVVKTASNRAERPSLLTSEHIELDIPFDATELSLYLIDHDAEPHDWFEETPHRVTWGKSILSGQIETSSTSWLDVIAKGEGVTTEFKEWLPPNAGDSKFRELLQTVIAFANTKGGTIFIGVDNNGQLPGIQRKLQEKYGKDLLTDFMAMCQKYQQELLRMIRDNVAPDVDFDSERYSRGGSMVLAIKVIKGKEPPYHLFPANDIWVRHGASNVRPSTQDLEILLPKHR